MTTFRLKNTNGQPPKIAMIEGTHPKYGLERNWRRVSKSHVRGTDQFAFTVDDGILEISEGEARDYYSVHGDRIVKLDGIVPRAIGEFMSENRCSRDAAWGQIYEALRQAHVAAAPTDEEL